MCSKCVYTPADTGKRPRNTGYSSQSIKARSLSAKITKKKKERKERERMKQEEKTWKRSMQKKRKRKKICTLRYTFKLAIAQERHERVHFSFGKYENKFSPRAVCTSLLDRIVRQSGTFDFSPDISSLKNASANSSRVTAAAINEALMHPDSCRNFIDDLQFRSRFLPIRSYVHVELKMFDGYRRAIRVYLRMYITEINL